MALAITEDHQGFEAVARSFLQDQGGRGPARAHLDAPKDELDPLWAKLSELGWPGMHLPEEFGGQGYGLSELALLLEEAGRVVAPVPLLPTTISSAVIDALGTDEQRAAYLPGLASGETVAAISLGVELTRDASGKVSGSAGPVLAATLAQLLLLPLGDDLLVVQANDASVSIEETTSLDQTLRFAEVTVTGLAVDDAAVIRGGRALAITIGRVLASAEAVGGAYATTEMAVEYAKIREQFGRPIGTFQAIKHHCSNMRVSAELSAALVWDAARVDVDSEQAALVAAAAAAIALPGYQKAAQQNIQLHGGIGFTWEHDAHLYFKRATVLNLVFGAANEPTADLVDIAASGVRRTLALDLPPEAAAYREEAHAYVESYWKLDESERRASLASSGYLVPHWSKPYGRNASPVEQLVIEEEFADVKLPSLGIGGWVVLTLTQQANAEQVERWVAPSLAGELQWCQLFSEPGAGSDSAAVRTRGTRVDGGWMLNGQKVWTSGAQNCNVGLATIRTDPDAKKHEGITAMVVDMKAKGVTVRPLREITGESMFNEVFFDDVFVPDENVVGEVNGGWKVARATLGNERVSIGNGSMEGVSAYDLVGMLDVYAADDASKRRQVGRLIAQELAMRLLNVRSAARAVAGSGPGAEGNISKLLSAEHAQQVTEAGMDIGGLAALTGKEARVAYEYVFDRCLSIAGGTSEITRNVIAERILGLPRDPLSR